VKRRIAPLIVLAALALAAVATAASHKGATCPLAAGTPTGGDVQWAFTVSGKPTGARPNIRTTYTHGRGNWTSGKAKGTVCVADTPRSGATRNLVLSTNGAAKLTGHVTRFKYLGVSMILPLKVTASDDKACPTGSKGTATLFASYYGVHVDSVTLAFAKGCTGHNHTFKLPGVPSLRVGINRHGAQVN
jgi:hypothetical protein